MEKTPENESKVAFERLITKLPRVKLFSNLRGNFYAGKLIKHNGSSVVLGFARRLKAGCGPDGMPDYIGWRQLTITPDMIGKTIAQFCAMELKRFDGQGRTTPEQIDMRDLINAQGGFAHIISSIDQAQQLLGEPDETTSIGT